MRVRTWLCRLAVIAVAGLLVTSCSSANLAVAKSNCALIAQWSGPIYPPGTHDPYPAEIERAPQSGIPSLDEAMHELAQALRGTNNVALNHAIGKVDAACTKLKFWSASY